MLAPALLPTSDPLALITATLFPHDTVARKAFTDALFWAIEDRLTTALAGQAESQRRAQRLPTEEAAAEIGISKEHLLRLARRGEVKREQAPGTRRYYFNRGGLLDWAKANMREDGGLKHSKRQSAPGPKHKLAVAG
jgi:hypothetical protein